MNGIDARKQRVILQEISDSLNRIANFLEDKHLKVYVSNEPHPLEGVQSTFKTVDYTVE